MLFVVFKNHTNIFLRRCQNLKANTIVSLLDIQDEVLRCLLDDTQFAIWHEVLRKLFLLVWHEPCEVGLVFSIDSCHQFDIRAEACTDGADG